MTSSLHSSLEKIGFELYKASGSSCTPEQSKYVSDRLLIGQLENMPVMRDNYNLLIFGNASLVNQLLKVIALPLSRIIFQVDRLRATVITKRIGYD
jgi:hypothetical protein